ncbi:MAG TPA: cysteine desulfurase family protein [Candidatus Saccharimonadales bacterium]
MPKGVIYLDCAATTPVDERVLAAMQPYWREQFYNPSATYTAARDVAQKLQDARSTVARWLGARPSEIVFTAGATESINLAIHGVMRQYNSPDDYRGNIVVSAVEHPAVLDPALGYDCRVVPVDARGLVDLHALEAAIDDKTVLVSVMYANNEIGTVEPIKEIAQIVARKRAQRQGLGGAALEKRDLTSGQPTGVYPLYFHTDAAQAGNYLDLHVSRLGVDMLTLNGSKLYGPKQSGILYVTSHVRLRPLILGGGQERHMRSGTENVAGDIGFAAALDIAQNERPAEAKRLRALQQHFFDELEHNIPGATVNGSRKKRLPNNVHITFPGRDNERLLMQLDEAGVLAAAGSACSASDEGPSHVLHAIGVSDADARSSLRFSMGRGTTLQAIDKTVALLRHFVSD